MKTKIILSSLMLATLIIFSCNSGAKKDATENATQPANIYSCPMHSDVKSDKPGQCPDCGMDLEKVEKTDSISH
ncbi:MAG: hypothetical protein NTX97_05835 [Bacteroidetes bacterium]|nr:hypothetical protein [Bacteroidota bacterium]